MRGENEKRGKEKEQGLFSLSINYGMFLANFGMPIVLIFGHTKIIIKNNNNLQMQASIT